MDWNTPIRYVPMVGPIYQKRLENLEIFTLFDLLFHQPVRYDNFSLIKKISEVKDGEVVTVIGNVVFFKNIFTRNRKQIQKLELTDGSAALQAVWFNRSYLSQTIIKGTKIAVAGKVKRVGGLIEFETPEYELVRNQKPLIHCGRLVPVYSQTKGVSSKWLRSRISFLLESPLLINDYLPVSIRNKYSFLSLKLALTALHFPQNLIQIETAKERLAFDELLLLQLIAKIRRKQWQENRLTKQFETDEKKVADFIGNLPFTLTDSQQVVIKEILSDMNQIMPMNRLLQGDVGSGKTVVAAIAMYVTYLNGMQSLCMAPTEILANQHYDTLIKLFTPFKITVGLLTGFFKSDKEKNNSGSQYDIYVGTHALIEKKVKFDNVGLVVIDEQHRFGVRQRTLLRNKAVSPHVLTMTATPIPRTTALVFHGDLDLSYIDEMPIGRLPVKTWVVPKLKRDAAYAWIRKQISSKQKQQVFILCPFIDKSESIQSVKAANDEYLLLKKEIFPDLKIGLLHGKMKSKDKDETLSKFRQGKFDILVCTPVVEVGIDIPQATIMVIEAAGRFGLAQLHQLRGRVGRGNQQSYCLLFSENSSVAVINRLKYLEKIGNGRKLAEMDLKLRGSGKMFGVEQHGRDNLKIASYTDTVLVQRAQIEAGKLLVSDPNLINCPLLKQRILSGTINEVSPD